MYNILYKLLFLSKLKNTFDYLNKYNLLYLKHVIYIYILDIIYIKVEVNFMDDVGQTLLNWASAFGTQEMVEFLCSKGADVNKGICNKGTDLNKGIFSKGAVVNKGIIVRGQM